MRRRSSLVVRYLFFVFLVRKVLRMQFGTLTWTLDVCSFISAWHFNMVSASYCNLQLLFSISFGRSQGSAAGAAEDHMTYMLDALKCMGLMVRFWEEFHHLVCIIWHFPMFVVSTVLCMQCVTFTWIIDVFAVISEWHFNMVADSHCSCCSQCAALTT